MGEFDLLYVALSRFAKSAQAVGLDNLYYLEQVRTIWGHGTHLRPTGKLLRSHSVTYRTYASRWLSKQFQRIETERCVSPEDLGESYECL